MVYTVDGIGKDFNLNIEDNIYCNHIVLGIEVDENIYLIPDNFMVHMVDLREGFLED